MMIEQLIETWQIHNRINLYLLEAITPEALGGVAANGGRSVALQFAHIHSVRLMWLKAAAPELLESVESIPAKTKADKATITKETLQQALVKSGEAIERLLQQGFESGQIKGFKPHPSAFLGYLISHESYHRGEIGIILSQAGTPLDDTVSYGLWEWGKR